MFFLNAISYSSIRHMENSFLSILYLGALTLKNTEIPLFFIIYDISSADFPEIYHDTRAGSGAETLI